MFVLDSVFVGSLCAAHASPMPEFERVTLFDSLIVSAVGAESWYREILLS